MFNMKDIKKYLSNVEHLEIYILVFILYVIAIYERGLISGIDSVTFLIYTFGGTAIFVDLYLIFKTHEYKITFLKVIGYLFMIIYPIVKLYTGINNPLFLLFSLYFGLIFFLLFLFIYSDRAQKIRKFESNMYNKIKHVFTKKHNK